VRPATDPWNTDIRVRGSAFEVLRADGLKRG
jgi:hypothetical protein